MITVLLEDIRSIHNVGSAFRSSSGAGVAKIILTGITPTPDDLRISKTALGAEREVSWEYYRSSEEVILQYKTLGYEIISVEQSKDSISINSYKYTGQDVLVVFGNEITGVSTSTLSQSDYIIELPMHGLKNSLNVSVTIGIALYYMILSKAK